MRKIFPAVAALTLMAGAARGQAPDADIFLVSLSQNGGKLAVSGARNLTSRTGYDNQPNWSRDGAFLFFTSVREGEQADIYRIHPATGETTRITTTAPESEYSATPMPRRDAISVIRVEREHSDSRADQARRLSHMGE
jgi:Tol biopolymer transport system component